jgi:hypothetical protein
MYLIIRVLHVAGGALWFGFIIFVAFFLTPSLQEAGPDGAKVMAGLERRKLVVVIPVIATVTILSGIWLFWRYTAGFNAEVSRTHTAMTFGTGGALGILAYLIGMSLIGPNMAKARKAAARAATLPEGQERSALLASANAMRKRAATATRIVAGLVTITITLMSIAIFM